MKLASGLIHYYGGMDKESIPLCDAINALPGLKTIESCCGHGEKPFMIWFQCDCSTQDGLFFLTRCMDRRYWKHGYDWSVSLEVGDTLQSDYILPTYFVLQSQSIHGKKSVGKEAYKQAKSLIENMNFHLNHENFIKGFNIDLSKFRIER